MSRDPSGKPFSERTQKILEQEAEKQGVQPQDDTFEQQLNDNAQEIMAEIQAEEDLIIAETRKKE